MQRVYVHVTWTATGPAVPTAEIAELILNTFQGMHDPTADAMAYAAAPLDGLWRAGWADQAPTLADARGGAETVLRAATLNAGQTGVRVTGIEVLSEDQRSDWVPRFIRVGDE